MTEAAKSGAMSAILSLFKAKEERKAKRRAKRKAKREAKRGARFADVQPGLPPAVQDEIAESSIRHGQTMLNNRLEEDEILGINHDGSLQSRIVGQPPMFELILSKEPKLTLEVTVLKAYTTMQVRTTLSSQTGCDKFRNSSTHAFTRQLL